MIFVTIYMIVGYAAMKSKEVDSLKQTFVIWLQDVFQEMSYIKQSPMIQKWQSQASRCN